MIMRALLTFAASAAAALLLVTSVQAQVVVTLGPADSTGLTALDTVRVAVGTVAPDFTLEMKDGGTLTLSHFRGKKTVVLVFYRGHW